jgi:hypothetical protein
MRIFTTLAILGALLVAHGCGRRTIAKPTSTQKSHARLERIKSVPPDTLHAEGPGLEKTRSGVATRLIYRGQGRRHATNLDAVILYSQTYDDAGRVVARGSQLIGDPAVDLTSDGQEAIEMMVEGDVRRFWFPDRRNGKTVRVTDYEVVWISPDKD